MATLVPFVGGSYELKRKKSDVQRTFNLMPTDIESGTGKSKRFLAPTPGLTVFSEPVPPVPPPVVNPCLKLLLHLDGNVVDSAHANTVTTSGTFSYAAGKFSSAFAWDGVRTLGDPFQAFGYDGDPLVPDGATTGWTIEWFTNVSPTDTGFSGSEGVMDWAIFDDTIYYKFTFESYRLGKSGGVGLPGRVPGTVQHLAIVYDPVNNADAIYYYVDGVVGFVATYAGGIDFHKIMFGEQSTDSGRRSYGFVDEVAVWCCPQFPIGGVGVTCFTPRTVPIDPYA